MAAPADMPRLHPLNANIAVCQACGVEQSENERLRWKNKAIKCENAVLQQRLFEAGKINQNYEVRLRWFGAQTEELTKLREAASHYQSALASQQNVIETERRERALAVQSMHHEFKCHEGTEKVLEQERARVRELIGLLNTFDVPKRAAQNVNAGPGSLWGEQEMKESLEQRDAKIESLNTELRTVRDELQYKQRIVEDQERMVEDLAGRVEVTKALLPPASESSEEEGGIETAVLLPGRQRKRARS